MQQKELVEFIAKSLVDNPDQVCVRETEGEQASTLELSVARDDLGKIIGKQGRTAFCFTILPTRPPVARACKILMSENS